MKVKVIGQSLFFMGLLDKNYWTIIYISETVRDRVTKFSMVMNIDGIWVKYEGQGHKSKVKVSLSKM